MSKRHLVAPAVAACGLLAAPLASAHVSANGPAFAGGHQLVTFSIGHGCAGADTYRLEIQLPEEITSVRAAPSAFGDAEVVTDDAGIPTSVSWTKSEVKAADDQYYEFGLRIDVPDVPFTTLYFPATQVCRDSEGAETTVEWDALPSEEGEPAPAVAVVPARAPGWNAYAVPTEVADLDSYFGDAQIVWAGDAAYSANPATMALIEAEEDVGTLTAIEADTDIWVKY